MTVMQLQGARVRTVGCLCYHAPGWGTSLMLGFLPASLGSPAVPCLGSPDAPSPGSLDALLLYREVRCGLCHQPGEKGCCKQWLAAAWFEGGTSSLVTHALLGTGAE